MYTKNGTTENEATATVYKRIQTNCVIPKHNSNQPNK